MEGSLLLAQEVPASLLMVKTKSITDLIKQHKIISLACVVLALNIIVPLRVNKT
jgi:hypothetical protein